MGITFFAGVAQAAELTNYALGKSATMTPAPSLDYWANKDYVPVEGGDPEAVVLTMAQLMARLTDAVTFDYVELGINDDMTTYGFTSAVSWTSDSGTQSPRAIVIDLGEVKTDVVKVRVDNPVKGDFGPKLMGAMDVYGSEDGVTYTLWGSGEITGGDTNDDGSYYEETAQWVWQGAAKSARYVKVETTWSNTGTAGTESIYEVFIYGGEPDEPIVDGPINYARGKTATVTPDFPLDYWINDVGTQEEVCARLTDGMTSEGGGEWSLMAAYDSSLSESMVIVVDLEEVKTDIAMVQVDNVVNEWGTKLLSTAKVEGSTDGVTYTEWGDLSDKGEGEQMHPWTWQGADQAARYVRFTLDWPVDGAGSRALYEIYVFGGNVPEPVQGEINYARGKTLTVTPDFPLDYWINDAGTQEEVCARLTDGMTSDEGGEWSLMAAYDSSLSESMVIIVDLEEVKYDIAKIRVDNVVNEWGTKLLTSASVAGSIDGVTYTEWGDLSDTGYGLRMHRWIWQGQPQSARYVKYTLDWPVDGAGSRAIYEIYAIGGVLNAADPQHWTLY